MTERNLVELLISLSAPQHVPLVVAPESMGGLDHATATPWRRRRRITKRPASPQHMLKVGNNCLRVRIPGDQRAEAQIAVTCFKMGRTGRSSFLGNLHFTPQFYTKDKRGSNHSVHGAKHQAAEISCSSRIGDYGLKSATLRLGTSLNRSGLLGFWALHRT